jgi:predicted anti-sigma-YlaC factor YlaD
VFALVRPVRIIAKRLWALQLPTLREKGTTMWQTVYLCGFLITTIGALAAAERVSIGDTSARVTLTVGVVAGALWPLVMAGLVQGAAIALIARRCKAAAVRDSGPSQSIQLKEVLAFSS